MKRGNMKRVLENSHESIPARAKVRAELRHEYLSQDYLDLQKEFVSKMKNLKAAKERKQILLEEVHFLRGRYQYLMELQSRGTRSKEVLGVEDRGIAEWKNSALNAASELEREIEEDKVAQGMEEVDRQQSRGQVKYKSSLKSSERVKKNVTWQDQEAPIL